MATKSHPTHTNLGRTATLLLVAALLLVVAVPLVLNSGATFGGSDDAGAAAIAAMVPGYQPWIGPIWEPPSAEIESMLFALQAAAGGAIAGYVFGLRRGRAEGRTRPERDPRAGYEGPKDVSACPRSEPCD